MDSRNQLKEELKSGILQMKRQVSELQLAHEDRQGLMESLQQMQKKYRLLADNACDIISLHSIDGSDCLYVNPAISNILEYHEEDIVGSSNFKITDMVNQEDKDALLKIFNDTLEKSEAAGKLRYKKKNGGSVWFEVVGRLIYDGDDIPVVLLRARNINDQKMVENQMEKQYEELHRGYEKIEELNTQLNEYHEILLETNARLKHSEEQLQLALWGANECMWEWNMISGKFFMYDKWANVLGYDWHEKELSTTWWENYIHPDDILPLSEALQTYLEGKAPHFSVEARVKNGQGVYAWLLITGKLVFQDNQGRTLRMIGLGQDISRQKQARKKLEDSEAKYRNLFEKNPIGLCKFDREGNVTDVNSAMVDILGASSQQEIQKLNLFSKDNLEILPILDDLLELCANGDSANGELQITTRWGKDVWIYYRFDPLMDEAGNFLEAMLACEEITDRKQAEDKIRYLSFNDSLTGLYNRAFYEEELNRLDTKRQLPLTIVMIDLNGLKLINDAFGHKQGDLALQKVSEVLRVSCRQEDIIARVGGDEFIALLPKTSAQVAQNICRRIKENCQKVETANMKLSIALGMATKESVDQHIHDIEHEAEERMYRNKLLENRSTRNSFINSLEETLWGRGHETKEHTDRLHQILEAVSYKVGLTNSEIANLKLLASLHDIGKIAIPPSILEKETGLSEEEWDTVRKHPEIGYRIALSAPELAPIAEAILTHHENWDGTGYPLMIKGESIPLLARILAIADTYDVVRNGRPYQRALSKEKTLQEIQACAGTRFDPRLVEIFTNEISSRNEL
ncbi:hypothetical protein ASZ90_017555 [hydrocarbon metagenome]|uniref:Uncharacterized protein n=1 Tax=hydrocarbon metagenome TaxID=938273 RepID=A0A0W8E8W6_9ZZZZ